MEKIIHERKFNKTYRKDGNRYRITVTAEIHDLGQGPYFSMTYDQVRQARNNRWMEDSCGYFPELIARRFPKLKKYLRWHLCFDTGPMHYITNSLYWAGYNGWCNGGPHDPPNLEYLKSTMVHGALSDDPDMLKYIAMPNLMGDLQSMLENRLPRLIEAYHRDMAELFAEEKNNENLESASPQGLRLA